MLLNFMATLPNPLYRSEQLEQAGMPKNVHDDDDDDLFSFVADNMKSQRVPCRTIENEVESYL